MDCPEENELLDFVRGDLSEQRRDALEIHVDECPVCPIVLAELARLEQPDDELAVTDGDPQALPVEDDSRPKERVKVAPLLREGDKVGRYVILNEVGAGGMGVVYAAYDPELDRKVAIKLLLTSLGGSLPKELEEQRARLMREAQAMAKLSHPNVITVHDVGEFRGQVFVAMEFIDGTTLGGWRKAEDRSWRDVLNVFLAAGSGLAAAHHGGLVHRDFKPDNVLIGNDGRVIVTDFGLARPAAGRTDTFASVAVIESTPVLSAQLTATGALVGTPAYMAPEQLAGERSDALADQFSFCVALYEALYGERPFEGKVLSHLMANVASGHIRAVPREANVPRWIRRALLKGLAVLPEDRHRDMPNALQALRKDPRRLWRRWGAIVLPTAVLGLGIVAYQPDPPEASDYCENVSAQLDGVWDEPTRTRLESAFIGTDKNYAAEVWTGTAKRLEDYSAQWLELQEAACVAELEGSQPQALLVLRMSCLERHLEQLRTLTSEFAVVDDALLDRATDAADALPDPAICSDVDRLTRRLTGVDSASGRKARNELDLELARAKVLRNTGRYDRGASQAEASLERARELGDRWIEAEALAILGDIRDLGGDPENATRNYQLAMSAALASDNSSVVIRVAIGMLWVLGGSSTPLTESEQWYSHGLAGLERLGDDPDLAAQLENAIAAAYLAHNSHADAEVHMRKALELRTRLVGADHPTLNSTWTNLGRLYASQKDAERAKDAFEKAHALTVAEYGPKHPMVASVLQNLGAFHAEQRHHEIALGFLEQALEVREAAGGPDHLHNAPVHYNIGHVLRRTGVFARAIKHYQRGFEIERNVLGGDAVELADTLRWIAWTHYISGDSETALKRADEAIAIVVAAKTSPAYLLPDLRGVAAWILLDLGRLAEAKRMADAAATGFQEAGLSADPDVPVTAAMQALIDALLGQCDDSTIARAGEAVTELRAQKDPLWQRAEAEFAWARTAHACGDDSTALAAINAALESYSIATERLGVRADTAKAWREETLG